MVSAIGDAVHALFEGEQTNEDQNELEIVASEGDSDVDHFAPT